MPKRNLSSKDEKAKNGKPTSKDVKKSAKAEKEQKGERIEASGSEKGKAWFQKNKQAVTLAAILVVVLIAAAIWAAVGESDDGESFVDKITNTSVVEVEEERARVLDGVLVSEDAPVNSVPLFVMIENLYHSDVRPQAGISRARIVHETIAEASITRFGAVFLPEDFPELIGPVRSSRHYYLEFQGEYDNAPYAHAGGSPEAMAAIDGLGVRDVSALSSSAKYFYRGAGSAPHNLFTTNELMELMIRDREYTHEPEYDAWLYDEDQDRDERPDSQEVVIDWASGTAYDARYVYDPELSEYARFHGDDPHTDRNTDEQVKVKNILIQRVPAETYLDSGKGRVNLDITGKGEGWVIRDGEAIKGTWEKDDRLTRTRWYDESGDEIVLRRGVTWFHTVPGDREVTITPSAEEAE